MEWTDFDGARPGDWTRSWIDEKHRELLQSLGVAPEHIADYVRRRWPRSFQGVSVVDGRITDRGFWGDLD